MDWPAPDEISPSERAQPDQGEWHVTAGVVTVRETRTGKPWLKIPLEIQCRQYNKHTIWWDIFIDQNNSQSMNIFYSQMKAGFLLGPEFFQEKKPSLEDVAERITGSDLTVQLSYRPDSNDPSKFWPRISRPVTGFLHNPECEPVIDRMPPGSDPTIPPGGIAPF